MEQNKTRKEVDREYNGNHSRRQMAMGAWGRTMEMGDNTQTRGSKLRGAWPAFLPLAGTAEQEKRGIACRKTIGKALERLEALCQTLCDTSADHEHSCSYSCSWLSRALDELSTLRPMLLDEMSASASEWSDQVELAATQRAHLLIPLERFFENRVIHIRQLDELFADIKAACLGMGDEARLLANRIGDWIRRERKLRASDNDLMFRLYWDDIGGEA